ncbi:uncharacterized protein PHACADRAFT_103109, partial [Phanerochaete carnosa HHB-10118-sp]
LAEWSSHHNDFLSELLRAEGLRGNDTSHCSWCPSESASEALLQCKDCVSEALLCDSCCILVHATNPFHCVQRWNGQFFDKITLKDLGLVFQVGHPPDVACINPRLGPRDFVVVHTNGIHSISIRYCKCNHFHEAGDTIQQLLRYELYPATLSDPTTCFTYCVLEHFSMLTL